MCVASHQSYIVFAALYLFALDGPQSSKKSGLSVQSESDVSVTRKGLMLFSTFDARDESVCLE